MKNILDYGVLVLKDGKAIENAAGFILDERFHFSGFSMHYLPLSSQPGDELVEGYDAHQLTRLADKDILTINVEGLEIYIKDVDSHVVGEGIGEVFHVVFDYNGSRYAMLQGLDVGALDSELQSENKNTSYHVYDF